MAAPMGLLISSFDYSPVAEDEFHDWYDMEHIPERARIPGFLDCTRWLALDLPKVSLNTYDLASIDVLRSDGYLAVGYENNSPWTRRVGWRCIKRLRFEGIQARPGDRRPPGSAEGLVVIAMNPVVEEDEGLEPALDRWMEATAGVPGVVCVRRFRATTSTHRHIVLCHFDKSSAIAMPAWRESMAELSTWTVRARVRDFVVTNCARYRRHVLNSSGIEP